MTRNILIGWYINHSLYHSGEQCGEEPWPREDIISFLNCHKNGHERAGWQEDEYTLPTTVATRSDKFYTIASTE